MNRQNGYYWVKVKNDVTTRCDLDVMMGIYAPKPEQWTIAKLYDDNWWEIDGYNVHEGYFDVISEYSIPAPNNPSDVEELKSACYQLLRNSVGDVLDDTELRIKTILIKMGVAVPLQ